MPDNRLEGMLEDRLVGLIPEASSPLFELARNCVADSKRQGAPFREAHRTKAEIHTWLAWQDEPGLRLYDAVMHRVPDPKRPGSRPFVSWFRSLFRVWIPWHTERRGTELAARDDKLTPPVQPEAPAISRSRRVPDYSESPVSR